VHNKTLAVIIGPTGIGKTDLSIEIALALKAEIISCDSRQMYRELKIGTAAPEPFQMATVKHHFIGNLTIHDYYNAGEFEVETLKLLGFLFKFNDYTVMTGGSGLYIDAVVKGIDDLPTIDPLVRNKYISLLQEKGIEHLQKLVEQVDPNYFNLADTNNSKRLLKALEVWEMTGKPYSSFRTSTVKQRPFRIKQVGLQMDRDELYNRIDLRVDKMLQAGLIDEARNFYPYKHLNSLNTVGYKELFGHFDGEYDLEEAIRLIKRNSRRYAKRQITWFNRDKTIRWFHPSQKDDILNYIKED